jgi:hypothetical protein
LELSFERPFFGLALVDGEERVEYGKVGLELGGFAGAEERYEAAEVLQIERVVVVVALDVHALEGAVEALVAGQTRADELAQVAQLRVDALDGRREAVLELGLEALGQTELVHAAAVFETGFDRHLGEQAECGYFFVDAQHVEGVGAGDEQTLVVVAPCER